MCGITGLLSPRLSPEEWQGVLDAMTDSLEHRGPDDRGTWWDAELGVGLGMRRLAIIDLSPAGHQPMVSASGRFRIVYNGEVYNHRELRRELEELGHRFRGTSDTEVILAAVESWGLEQACRRFNGMFAIALWDGRERTVSLVRDRLGIKPLYYGWLERGLLFASELKALVRCPRFHPEISRDALGLFLRLGYIPAPYSIFEGVSKLRPGSLLTVPLGGSLEDAVATRFWDLSRVVEEAAGNPVTEVEEAEERLHELLRDAVRKRMIADVPLGAFLSGGTDSSALVAMMQEASSAPVKTFSIGFHEEEIDEAPHAEAVARHLGTDHTELYVSALEAREAIPALPAFWDEPFADSTQIPTYLVSRLARQQVTVSLSGDGGDELFFGYGRYLRSWRRWERARKLPAAARKVLASGASSSAVHRLAESVGGQRLAARLGSGGSSLRNRLRKMGRVLGEGREELFYYSLVSQWQDASELIPGAEPGPIAMTDPREWPSLEGLPLKMMYLDLASYIPDDILVKTDRASMAVSLEARVPFLDHRMVELAWRLPLRMKYHDGQQKWILRRILDRYFPQGFLDRPKQGFTVPVDQWIRGPLREWAEALLAEERLRREGFVSVDLVRRLWEQHLSGTANNKLVLWNLLMFQAWLESQSSPALAA